MPIISPTAISPHRIGFDWSSYWRTLISATVENAAPTHVVLTFPTAQTSLTDTDFTIAGFTIASASWTGAVLTIELSTPVMQYHGDLEVTLVLISETATVINNINDGKSQGWYVNELDYLDVGEDNKINIYFNKEHGESWGEEMSSGNILLYGYYLITATEEDFFYEGCEVGDKFVCRTQKTLGASNRVKECNGYPLVPYGASKPTYTTDGSLFDGVADQMRSRTVEYNQPITVYMVLKEISYTQMDQFFQLGYSATSPFIWQYGGSGKIEIYAGVQAGVQNGAGIGNWSVLIAKFNGESSSLQINGGDVYVGDAGTRIGRGMVLGSAPVSRYSNILFKEIIIRNSADDSDTMNSIGAILASRHGIPWSGAGGEITELDVDIHFEPMIIYVDDGRFD